MNHRIGLVSVLLNCVVCFVSARAAFGGDRFTIQNNTLLGNNDVFHAELPPSLLGQALVADASQQDFFVLGTLYDNISGLTPLFGAVRYGRTGQRGEARILVGPAELGITYTAGQTYVMSGGIATAPTGPVLGVTTGNDAKIYLYAARTLAGYIPSGSTVNVIDLTQKGLAMTPVRMNAMVGNGTRLYAASATQPLLVQVDLTTNAVSLCRVDSQPAALAVSAGQVQVLTDKGTAQFMGDCSATTLSALAPKPTPLALNTLDLPARTYFLNDRIIEPTLPNQTAGSKARRGIFVSLLGGTSAMININAGTCTRTTFLAGDVFATPTVTTQVNLTTAASSVALYAEQTYPGEDCQAILTSGSGEALLRIRGGVENLGATVFMLDRSWSMERANRGNGAAANVDDSRITALRHAVISVMGSISLLFVPAPFLTPTSGPWAFMPFTDDAPSTWATPQVGFTIVPALNNPDNSNGMRIKGFASSGSDKLDPGGPSQLGSAMNAGLTRLQVADGMPPDTTGAARRLWILTDNESGKTSYSAMLKDLPTLLKARASVRVFGIGGLGIDPLLPLFLSTTRGLSGDRQTDPGRGHTIEVHTPSGLHEAVVAAAAREIVRARPLGTIGRGEINMAANKSINAGFKLTREPVTNREDPYVLYVAAWDHTDATMQLQILSNSNTIYPRCVRSETSMVCATPGFQGDWVATLSGSRPGGLSTFGVIRAFLPAWGPGGEVLEYSGFAKSLYKSGQRVRVQVYLTERGLPLRLASITARVTGPNSALGTVAAQAKIAESDISNLLLANGDLSPGQAKLELMDPMALPGQRQYANLTLYDDGANGGDTESQDGIYQGEFQALLPGLYTVDIHASYTGIFPNNAGTIEDRLTINVIDTIDQTLTSGSLTSEPLSGGLRMRFTPQDANKNLLGPGQAGALMIAQTGKMASAVIDDFLDGSYRADVTGIDPSKPMDLIAPASRIQLYDPANPNPGGGMSSGCSMVSPAATSSLFGGALLLLGLVLLAFRRARRSF